MNVKRSYKTKVIHASRDNEYPLCQESLKGRMPAFTATEQAITCLKCQGTK